MGPCSGCIFWLRTSTILTEPGQCRRYPPIAFGVPLMHNGQPVLRQHSLWPLTDPSWTCGEMQPRLQEVVVEFPKKDSTA